MHHLTEKLMTFILGIVVLLTLALPFSAFSAALSMEYSLGFNGHFQLQTWTPLTVILENRGRATSGTLEVIVTSGSEFLQNVHQTTHSMDVELPYNSTKLCSFTILLETFVHDLHIRLRHDDTILLSHSFNLRPYYTTKSFALVVNDKTSPDFLSGLPQSLFPVNVRHTKFLPETWYGYEGVKMTIIDAEMLKSLRESQFRALTQWIEQGGYVITASGINYGALLNPRFQTLLPIRIVGHQQFLELSSLEEFSGQALINESPFLVLHADIDDSDVLVQEDEIPLLIQKTLGFGSVMFLAFDFQNPPFSRWDGRKKFWESILSQQPVVENKSIDINTQKILNVMLSKIPGGFPKNSLVFLFLAVYLFLLRSFVKTLERIEKKRGQFRSLSIEDARKKKWRHFYSLLVMITIFSLVSYGFFFYPNTRKKLVYNSFLLMNIDNRHNIAFGKHLAGLYFLKNTAFNVRFGSGSYPLIHLVPKRSDKNVLNQYVMHNTPGGQRVRGISEKWSYNFFLADVQFEFPITGQANWDEEGLRITIENMSPYKIVDCQVYFFDRLFSVGDIPLNTKQTKRIAQGDINNTKQFDKGQAKQIAQNIHTDASSSFFKILQKNLAEDVLLAIDSQYHSQRDTLYLVGWIQSGIIQMNFIEKEVSGEELTLITWEIPVKRET